MPTSGSDSICCTRVTICGTPGNVSGASSLIDARSFSSAAASCATMFSMVVVPNAIAGISSSSECALECGDFFGGLIEHGMTIAHLQLHALQTFHQIFIGHVHLGAIAVVLEQDGQRQHVGQCDRAT